LLVVYKSLIDYTAKSARLCYKPMIVFSFEVYFMSIWICSVYIKSGFVAYNFHVF